jgi:hypothetical protein
MAMSPRYEGKPIKQFAATVTEWEVARYLEHI